MSSYVNSNYHPVGMMNSVINSDRTGSSSNNNSNRYNRPDYPTPEWPIVDKKYDTDYDIPALTEKGRAELDKDRREYAEAQNAKFKMDKDPYPEPSSWRKYLTGTGGRRRTRKARKARKTKKNRKTNKKKY